ncbi:MAG TPA: 2-C-methyl-D-erythritol 4-phosphate cytidylyltransferase [Candidatus Acidoferrales bacterium]|nr:2-C-methyl-D-erythritol 4-phosphate cytidylyltransferase [Candidatus Acidoferrales bacterium]
MGKKVIGSPARSRTDFRGIGVIIPAAGAGSRLGGLVKPLVDVNGSVLLARILGLFRELTDVKKICIAVPKTAFRRFEDVVQALKMENLTVIVEGGDKRAISVRNAYEQLRTHITEKDLVCIHDAARPLLSKSDLDSVIDAGWKYGAAFLAAKIKDTLKVVDEKNFCERTIDRSSIYGAQTPQVMLSKLLSKAYKTVRNISEATDEITLMEKIGVKALAVEPRHLNPKLTTHEDLELIKRLIS